MVYDELHQVARKQMAWQSPGHTLQPTAVVNEVYMKLVNSESINWEGRTHFIAHCATMIRRLLIDHFRKHKRKVQLDDINFLPSEKNLDLIELDEALSKLSTFDPRKSQIVEMRFFGGMTMEEIAAVLQVSEITVKREWGRARGWLLHELGGK
jgi:RNA polymerase sigma factor (TIGR02999 family)